MTTTNSGSPPTWERPSEGVGPLEGRAAHAAEGERARITAVPAVEQRAEVDQRGPPKRSRRDQVRWADGPAEVGQDAGGHCRVAGRRREHQALGRVEVADRGEAGDVRVVPAGPGPMDLAVAREAPVDRPEEVLAGAEGRRRCARPASPPTAKA